MGSRHAVGHRGSIDVMVRIISLRLSLRRILYQAHGFPARSRPYETLEYRWKWLKIVGKSLKIHENSRSSDEISRQMAVNWPSRASAACAPASRRSTRTRRAPTPQPFAGCGSRCSSCRHLCSRHLGESSQKAPHALDSGRSQSWRGTCRAVLADLGHRSLDVIVQVADALAPLAHALALQVLQQLHGFFRGDTASTGFT